MTAAECLIVSARAAPSFDAYVLSESSLFVYDKKVVLKTCGTTKLLEAIPVFLAEAAALGMAPRRVKYTRSTFDRPEEQPLDGCFARETAFLERLFGALGPDGGNAFVLGSATKGVQWHVYVADDDAADEGAEYAEHAPGNASPDEASPHHGEGSECSTQEADGECVVATRETRVAARRAKAPEPTVSLEVCMTDLCETHAKHFVRDQSFVSSRATTEASGIAGVFPNMDVDDYVFEPCGYSMNGLCGDEYSTIHITPEAGFSYCSVEHSNVPVSVADPEAYARKVAKTFNPGRFSLAVSTDAPLAAAADIRRVPSLPGYRRVQASHQEIDASGGAVSFYTFVKETSGSRRRAPAAAGAAEAGAGAPLAAGSDKYESDEEAPERKKMRAGSPTSPGTPSLAGPGGGSMVAESVDFLRAPSVNHLPALPAASARNPMSDFAGLVTLRTSLPTARPLASTFKNEAPEVISALAANAAKPIAGGGPRCIDNCVLDVIEEGLSAPSAERLERFLVVDLGVVTRRWHYWRSVLPRVLPHYAVKCNMDTGILSTLASLGASFDCASPTEVDVVMSLGVSPDRVIYANPCKLPRHLAAVSASGVGMTTFDSAGELAKIAALAPDMRVLLRLRADDPDARCVLGNKYGAEPAEVEPLLLAAKALGVKVAGCAFHVGSGATNPLAFREALEFARVAFDTAARIGLPPMDVLDIGGGFSGALTSSQASNDNDVTLTAVAGEVNESLERLFPAADGVRVISEPGRYFSEACVTLACQIFSRRIRSESEGSLAPGEDSHQYFVTDGLYGMMNSIMYDHATITSRVLPVATNAAALAQGNTGGLIPVGVNSGEAFVNSGSLETFPSTVFGPTCDGLDKIHEQTALPELAVGDWLVFPHMGAYTVSAGSNFNGFSCADVKTFYVGSSQDADPENLNVRR